jgi:hypothetical protein
MSTPCLVFARSYIPQRLVNYCRFWMPIRVIIKSTSPLTMKKIVFITPFGIYCYTKMAFRLKNKGATYQRCIQIILEEQIEQNVKAYIDDVIVKWKKHGDLLDDLKETFNNLCKYKMMLDPKKMCVRCIIRQTAQLHGIGSRDRREPE